MKQSIKAFIFLLLILPSLTGCTDKEQSKDSAVKSSTTQPQAKATVSIQASMETARLAAQYSKDNPEIAALLAQKRNIFKLNQETITKKIGELSPEGKALVEKEQLLVAEISKVSKIIADKNGVGADEQQTQRLKSQKELIELRKKKMELSRQVISTPEMKQALQVNYDNIRALDEKIAALVNDIKVKQQAAKVP